MSYNPLKDEIFLPIPLKIAQRKDLKNLSKLVYGYLLKCFGKDGLVCPTMKKMGDELKVSRQMISKCITELKSKGLIEIQKTGKASRYEFCDVNTVVTSDVNTVVTSDVNTVVTTPILKDKEKEKIKKSAAAPDSIHPNLNSVLKRIPFKKIKKASINECLNNQGESYIDYLLRVSEKADNPEWYFRGGVLGYYADYLKSPEYAVAGFKTAGYAH